MNIYKRIKTFANRWRQELWGLPVLILVWWISPSLLRFIDPTAATYDAGIFQVILFTIIQFLTYNMVAWIVIRLTFPSVFNYFQKLFINDFKSIQIWHKLVLSLSLYCFLLLELAILSRVI